MNNTPNTPLIIKIWSLILLYFAISSIVWQWRNPTANAMTCFSNFNHVIRFEKMTEFQVEK